MMYLRLGLLATFLGVCGLALWYRGNAIAAAADAAAARADLSTALAANAAQEATIGRLRASAEANDRILAETADRLDAISRTLFETNSSIVDLKDANEDVRSYLGTPVPPDLRLLLDR